MPPGLPNPPNVPTIIRQPGESYAQFRARRYYAETGETLYQRRIRLGQAQGLSRAEARGHGTLGGQTEAARAESRYQAQYGMTRSQYYTMRADQWLAQNGYTPQTTGWSQTRLRRAEPWLRYFMEGTSGAVTPEDIAEMTDVERTTYEPNKGFDALQARYRNTRAYREQGNKDPGREAWEDRDIELPAIWWYYH